MTADYTGDPVKLTLTREEVIRAVSEFVTREFPTHEHILINDYDVPYGDLQFELRPPQPNASQPQFMPPPFAFTPPVTAPYGYPVGQQAQGPPSPEQPKAGDPDAPALIPDEDLPF